MWIRVRRRVVAGVGIGQFSFFDVRWDARAAITYVGETARSLRERACAPLLFAGHAVMIAVHFHVRAIAKEEGGFGTGRHL